MDDLQYILSPEGGQDIEKKFIMVRFYRIINIEENSYRKNYIEN